ncbi:MAG: TrmH family RNA methyltransferase [Ardenticatenia bacterium]|nr:TrmH family RNA methyltransferase [Ardenticatenia bacterium]
MPELVRGLRVRLADVRATAHHFEVNWRVPSALIVGGETTPVGETVTHLAHERVVIPLARGVESLNVAVAAAVVLFEARRQRLVSPSREEDAP